MSDKKSRMRRRPLLVAGLGAVITISGCGSTYSSTGNLMAPHCPDGGVYTGLGADGCAKDTPADGGTDGGTGGDH